MAQKRKRWQKHNPVLSKKMGSPRSGNGRRGDEPKKLKVERTRKKGVEWAKDWQFWGRRVRRDILVIEAFLKAKFPDFDPYGDPGDPPPPPDDEAFRK